jgi:hypothetical protein
MLDLNKEAENYLDRTYNLSYEKTTWQKLHIRTFIAGAESKYVEIQKLKYAIEQLYRFRQATFGKGVDVIKELEEKLNELEK